VETVLLTVVEADDRKNQRSASYFSTFFIKNKEIKSFLKVADVNIIFQWLNWKTGT